MKFKNFVVTLALKLSLSKFWFSVMHKYPISLHYLVIVKMLFFLELQMIEDGFFSYSVTVMVQLECR